MSSQTIAVQINFNGKSPIITGDKRLTLINLGRLLRAMDHGSQQGLGTSYVQVQSTLVAASATATPAAVQSGDTLSIGGQALTAAQRRASGTITCATAIAADTVTINGVTFVGKTGAATPGTLFFSVDTSDTACAASIATQVNAYVDPRLSGVVAAKSAAAVVTVYAVNEGTGGNAYTLASSSNTTLAVSGATLANGAAVTNNTFDYIGTNATTGASIAAAINRSTTTAVKQTTATAASNGVVTVTAKVSGVAGNAVTFTSSSNTRLAVTGSGFLANGSAGAPTRWNF